MEIYLWLNIIDVGSNLILQIWSLGFFLKRLEIWTFCGSSCEFQNSTRQVGYTIFGFRPTLAQIDIIEIRVHSFLLPFIQSIWSKQQKHIYLFLNQILFLIFQFAFLIYIVTQYLTVNIKDWKKIEKHKAFFHRQVKCQ